MSFSTPPGTMIPFPIANNATSMAGVSPWLLLYTRLPMIVVSRSG
ncbi:unannotated protein [freshwater metagenome]|uniref:Unannotated protein n=1 Tax=freshwater metagenome TaxID=449393 RepID=A0A6J7CBM7_9ZZZZ